MQTREGMHRRRRGLIVALAGGLFLFLLPFAAGRASAAPDCASRLLAGCPRGCASGNFFHGIGAGALAGAGFHATASNPYLLDGLVSSDLLIGVDAGAFSAWLDWRHLGHALYREDGLTAAVGMCVPARVRLRFYAVPAIERRAPRGFGGVAAPSLSLGGSLDVLRDACVGYVFRTAGSVDPERRDARIFVRVRGRAFTLVVDGAVSGPRGGDAQCMLEAWLTDGCAIACAYRRETGETSSGLVVKVSRTILDISWRRHPALGSTVTAGAGRLWEW
jgi:hypothetical protein